MERMFLIGDRVVLTKQGQERYAHGKVGWRGTVCRQMGRPLAVLFDGDNGWWTYLQNFNVGDLEDLSALDKIAEALSA